MPQHIQAGDSYADWKDNIEKADVKASADSNLAEAILRH